jgi:predicted metal-dependent peptidase
MAGDFVINQILVDERIGAQIKAVPILLDNKYRGMASEEVYEELMKNAVKIQATLDIHMDGDGSEDGEGEGKSFKGEPLTEEEKKALSDELKEAVLQAAQASGAGNIPKGFQRLINDITAPKMNWRDMLKIQLNSIIKNDYSFMRPNRKGWHIGAVLPGMLPGDEVNIAIAIDTSGSISESMLKDFLGEIAGIMDQFDSYIVRVFQFDTHVYGEEIFSSDANSDIRTYEVRGGGGTDFEVIFTHLKQEDVTPNQLVVFTDGEPWGSWGDADYCDTLWIVHSNSNKKAPFGITTHYEA